MSMPDKVYEAFSMSLRGYTNKEIAASVGVTPTTVGGWLRKKKDEITEHLSNLKREDYIGIVMSRFEEMRRMAHDEFKIAANSGEKTRLIKLMMDITKTELNSLMDLGVLGKAPTVHEHKVSGSVSTQTLIPEDLDSTKLEALSAMLLADKMSITPEEILKMGGRKSTLELPEAVDAIIIEQEEEKDEKTPMTEPLDFEI